MKKKINKISLGIVVLGVFAIFFCSLYALRHRLLPWLVSPLVTENEATVTSDYLLLLMGDLAYRPEKAAEVYRKGLAKKILFCKSKGNRLTERGFVPREEEVIRRILVAEGVPDSAMEMVPQIADSTLEEAVNFKNFLMRQTSAPKSAMVLTSWYHSKRSAWIFSKVFRGSGIDIKAYGINTGRFGPENWWQSKEPLIGVSTEYMKYGYYLARYAFRDPPREVAGKADCGCQ